jgi:hypothetical protein
VRATAIGGVNHTFVYPRNTGDPEAEKVKASFQLTNEGFRSNIGSVNKTLYVGRTSAGGEGTSIDVDRDGVADVTFDEACRFVLQVREGRVLAVEADRPTNMRYENRKVLLDAYKPVNVGGAMLRSR